MLERTINNLLSFRNHISVSPIKHSEFGWGWSALINGERYFVNTDYEATDMLISIYEQLQEEE